jgi:TonB family protein
LSGSVEVEFVVDEAGTVVWAQVLNGHSLLRAAALKAVCFSSFRPASCGGRLIKAKERITYHFAIR